TKWSQPSSHDEMRGRFAEAPRHSRVLRVQAALRERGACLFEDPSASRYFVPASALPSPKGLVSIGPTGNSRAGGLAATRCGASFLNQQQPGEHMSSGNMWSGGRFHSPKKPRKK